MLCRNVSAALNCAEREAKGFRPRIGRPPSRQAQADICAVAIEVPCDTQPCRSVEGCGVSRVLWLGLVPSGQSNKVQQTLWRCGAWVVDDRTVDGSPRREKPARQHTFQPVHNAPEQAIARSPSFVREQNLLGKGALSAKRKGPRHHVAPFNSVSTDQTTRSTIIFLISAIALAGFRCLGQVEVQFMIVWQR